MEKHKDDSVLLSKIKDGDSSAFRYLFDTYFVALCRFMYMYVPNKETVEDIALDIFAYLWENRQTVMIEYSFKSYLFQAARNRCLNELRRSRQTISWDEIDHEIIAPDTCCLESEELRRLIQEAVLSLPEKCRETFRLSREEELSNKEIATRLNVSVKTVEGQITKALKRIKVILGEYI